MSEDIFGFGKPQDLVPNPFAAFEDKADPTVPTATLQIYQFIDDYLKRESDTYVTRASAATQCPKRRQLQRQGAPAEKLTPRKVVNFLLGDLAEKSMLYFLLQGCVGPGKLYSEVDFGEEFGSFNFNEKVIRLYKQKEMILNVPDGPRVTCHPDGLGKRNSDGKWELIEVKSAANWGFNSFKGEEGAGDYLRQAHATMQSEEAKALGIDSVRFFYVRKETGHIWDRLHQFDIRIAQQVLQEYRQVESDEEIPAPHGLIDETFRKKPTGRKVAGFPCTYCPYLEKCQGKHTVEWKNDQFGHGKPVYVFDGGSK